MRRVETDWACLNLSFASCGVSCRVVSCRAFLAMTKAKNFSKLVRDELCLDRSIAPFLRD